LPKKEGFGWEEAFDTLRDKEMSLEDFAYDHPLQFIRFAYGLKEFTNLQKQDDLALVKEKPSRILWIDGPSGCGKTTFVKGLVSSKKSYYLSRNLNGSMDWTQVLRFWWLMK
jgi:hypothetical protein